MTDLLIRARLRPPPTRPALVARPRLQRQIAQGLRGPLTLITAPAGSGKTTLLAAAVADAGMPVAWLSLDAGDNRAERFLRYLTAALHAADPARWGEHAALLLAAHRLPPDESVASLINALESAGGELLLALDDYHLITSQAIQQAVALLVERCPPTFHLAIISRAEPALPLARLRARGQLLEIRAADLRFSQAEAAQFLHDVMGLRLDNHLVALLEQRTEGWIAGLQLAALSIRDCDDARAAIERFSGANRYILDYLLEEVLAREPEAAQSFLLQTAVLSRLSGPLCDALTGASDGQQMLERLERRGLFLIPLDDERRWYRYHHLFADLLRARLQQAEPDQPARLLARATDWCERSGYVVEAVDYALAARDMGRAAGLVERHWGQLVSDGAIETLWSWLEALPESTLKNSAPLSVAYCWGLWLRGQIDLIAPRLADAERALASSGTLSPTDAARAQLPAQLLVLRAFVARYGQDFARARALAEQALSLLPAQLPPHAEAELRMLIALALSSAHEGAGDLELAVGAYGDCIRWSRAVTNLSGVTGITYRMLGALRLLGRLRAAEHACRDALAYIQAQGMTRLPAVGILHVAMSEVLIERNALAAAEEQLAQGLALGRWSGRLDAVRNAADARSRLRQARQDAAGALAAVAEAAAALGEPASPLAQAELLALKASLLVRQRALGEAARCVVQAERLAGRDQGQTGQLVALAAARLQAAQGRPDDVHAALTRSLGDAEARGRWGVALELRILRSLALARLGDARTAAADLDHALALAEPEGYVRIFLDAGRPMQALLASWLADAPDSPRRAYAAALLAQFEPAPPGEPATSDSALVEPLTQREREILQLIALGRTNREIARQLIIAPGTVKAHTASIYHKLDVANRTAAVARARQLGLL